MLAWSIADSGIDSFCILHSAFCIPVFGQFPRGPGFYFNPFKFFAVIAVYMIWVKTTWWVDSDCRQVGLPTIRWNPIMLGCGLAGLLLVWSVPVFMAGFLALSLPLPRADADLRRLAQPARRRQREGTHAAPHPEGAAQDARPGRQGEGRGEEEGHPGPVHWQEHDKGEEDAVRVRRARRSRSTTARRWSWFTRRSSSGRPTSTWSRPRRR